MSNWFTSAIAGIVKPVVELIDHNKERKHKERVGELGMIEAKWKGMQELALKGQAHLANWEMASLKNSGWKDEFVLLVMYYPIISLFTKHFNDPLVAIEALDEFPEWYTTTLMVITFAVYGIRLTLNAASGLFNKGKK